MESARRQDVTQDEGSYDQYLDQDEWYAKQLAAERDKLLREKVRAARRRRRRRRRGAVCHGVRFAQAAEEEAREEANAAADAARAAEAEREAAAERAVVDAQRERLRRSLEATQRAEADAAATGGDGETRQGGGGGGTFGLAGAARPGGLGEFGPETAEIADDADEEWTDEVRNAVVRQLVPAFDNLPAEETVRATRRVVLSGRRGWAFCS